MPYEYDTNNVFARILRGEIPCNKVAETEHSLAFRDISPQAPKHVLVIPKGAYVSHDHFTSLASDAEIADFNRLVGQICRQEGLSPDEAGSGYRLISNCGADGRQEVPHLHVHVLGGHDLGRMLQKPTGSG